MLGIVLAAGALAWGGLSAAAGEEDALYVLRVSDLEFTGNRPPTPSTDFEARTRLESLPAYAVLDGVGEAYLDAPLVRYPWGDLTDAWGWIALRVPKGAEVSGTLFGPKADGSGMARYRFRLPAGTEPGDPDRFHEIVATYYGGLRMHPGPGAAWFRYREFAARRAHPGEAEEIPPEAEPFRRQEIESELAATCAMFTGARAVAENLQLDRVMPRRGADEAEEERVDVASIVGVTTREIDWTGLLGEEAPQADPLARRIPSDQYALFFPSFSAMVRVRDEAALEGGTLLRFIEPISEDARTSERYERQLVLGLDEAARAFGPALVRSVAITGSDPFFRTGTDVAVLFEAVNRGALEALLVARQKSAASNAGGDAQEVKGTVGGVEYRGVVTPDRRICTYLAALGENVLVVANSLFQLERLVEASQGKSDPIVETPEYRFFRERYLLGDAAETGFLVLSDATIRRWCSPRWRIGMSRRTRAAAVLADLEARRLAARAEGETFQPDASPWSGVDLGTLTVGEGGVRSSVWGDLGFVTPVAEVPVASVTKTEAEAYRRWKAGYERNMTFFDPIAARFEVADRRVGLDVTVRPLILQTRYRMFLDVASGARLGENSGDPHDDALVQFVLALNPRSQGIAAAEGFARPFTPALTNPFGWLGDSVAIFLDDGPFWAELAQAEEREEFMQNNFGRFPLGIRVEAVDSLKLAAFLAGVRAFIEQTAPGMTTWENRMHGEHPYVRIGASFRSGGEGAEDFALYYAPTRRALLISTSEDLLQRSLDREAARNQAIDAAVKAPAGAPSTHPFLGESVALQAMRRSLDVFPEIMEEDFRLAMQKRAWANLPILNEWKRFFPAEDPIALHERVWKVRLVCPGGGIYVWNDAWKTMESTVYGHPGEPREGPSYPKAVEGLLFGNFGLTFEDDGLRARAEVEREAR